MEKTTFRSKRLTLHLSEKEHAIIVDQFTQTTHRHLGVFIREKVLGQFFVRRVHNASVDRIYEILTEIKTDLQLACDSFERCAADIKHHTGTEQLEYELIDFELKRRKLDVQLQKTFEHICRLAEQ